MRPQVIKSRFTCIPSLYQGFIFLEPAVCKIKRAPHSCLTPPPSPFSRVAATLTVRRRWLTPISFGIWPASPFSGSAGSRSLAGSPAAAPKHTHLVNAFQLTRLGFTSPDWFNYGFIWSFTGSQCQGDSSTKIYCPNFRENQLVLIFFVIFPNLI